MRRLLSRLEEEEINMVKFHEAEMRLFKGIYVCRKCKSTIKAPAMKVLAKQVKCRKCGSTALRVKRKK
jgi:ribosomal protein L40E